MRLGLLLLSLPWLMSAADPLPLNGISHVAFRVSDLAKARGFYGGVLGYPEAFTMKDPSGNVRIAFFKINDDQFIEVQPGDPVEQVKRMTHVCFVTTDAAKLYRILVDRGLQPTEPKVGGDGNRSFRLKDPEENILEFVEYLPGSLHSQVRGKFEDNRRVSTHLLHAGIPVRDAEKAVAFYAGKLGFEEFWRGGPKDGELRYINLRMPGQRGDYVELMIRDAEPTAAQWGSMLHICLDVPDIQKAFRTLLDHGGPDESRNQPKVGRNGRWQLNEYDPDGSRVEYMEPVKRP